MRSVSKGATLKHNPRTETRDKSRGRPSIINHVGHYLSLSLSLSLSHSHTHTQKHTQLPAFFHSSHFLPLSFHRQAKLFFCFSNHSFKRPHNFAGQPVTIAVIRTDSASLAGGIVCFEVFVRACVCVCASVHLTVLAEFLGKDISLFGMVSALSI